MYKFRNDITTEAPTCCLVEDYQTLQEALDALDESRMEDTKELITVVMECLASVIQDCTEVPGDVDIKPSPSSLIAMGCQEGILVTEDNTDFRCRGNMKVSNVLAGGVCQCGHSTCKHYMNGCDPERGRIALSEYFVIEPGPERDEKLLEELEILGE